jgi:phage-related protein
MALLIRKPLQFMGSSHDDLRAFPDEARREAGFNLDFVQRGFEDESTRYRLGQDAKAIRKSSRK